MRKITTVSEAGSRLPILRTERAAFLVATALLVTLAGFTAYARATTWTLLDLGVYLNAAENWLTFGTPYYTPEWVPSTETYRYAPWWAALFIPLTSLPYPVVATIWTALTVAAAVLVPADLIRRYGRWGIPFGALMLSLLVGSAAAGNVQPLLVVALYFGLHTRYGPWIVGLAASLKLTPILLAIPWLMRREWRRPTIAVSVAVVLLAPTLLFTLPSDIGVSGIESLIDSHPLLWGLLAVGSVLVAVALGRTQWAWLAAASAVVLTIPRSLGLDLSFLAPAARPPPRSRCGVKSEVRSSR